MAAAGFLKSVYLRYLAKPAQDRRLFSLVRHKRVANIVELGVGKATRAMRMIELAQRYSQAEVKYTGIDLFEARDRATDGLSLKEAYKQLRATGVKVQLVPGDPFSSLARTANSLTDTELLIVSADQDAASLERAWFYVPRMLSDKAHVLIERIGQDVNKRRYEHLSRSSIDSLAGANQQRQRAA